MKVYISAVLSRRGFYDRIIAWYSRSPVVHVEFHWPLSSAAPEQYLGAQPEGGVQIRPADYLGDAVRDTYFADLSDQQVARLSRWLTRQVGKPYDFRAIAGMVFSGLDKGRSDDAWFCSELVYAGLGKVGYKLLREPVKAADRITPRDVVVSLELRRLKHRPAAQAVPMGLPAPASGP